MLDSSMGRPYQTSKFNECNAPYIKELDWFLGWNVSEDWYQWSKWL